MSRVQKGVVQYFGGCPFARGLSGKIGHFPRIWGCQVHEILAGEEAKEEILALRCRAHLDAESAAAAAELEPVGGFAPYARWGTRQPKPKEQAAEEARVNHGKLQRGNRVKLQTKRAASCGKLYGFSLVPPTCSISGSHRSRTYGCVLF